MKLIIIIGISCAGKSTYSKTLNLPVISFDKIFNYSNQIMNYNLLKNNHVLDGYILSLDKNLEKIKQYGFNNIELHFIYTDIPKLYELTKERKRIMGNSFGFIDKGYDSFNNIAKEVFNSNNEMIKNIKKYNLANKIVYIYRNNTDYNFYNGDKHLNTLINNS